MSLIFYPNNYIKAYLMINIDEIYIYQGKFNYDRMSHGINNLVIMN